MRRYLLKNFSMLLSRTTVRTYCCVLVTHYSLFNKVSWWIVDCRRLPHNKITQKYPFILNHLLFLHPVITKRWAILAAGNSQPYNWPHSCYFYAMCCTKVNVSSSLTESHKLSVTACSGAYGSQEVIIVIFCLRSVYECCAQHRNCMSHAALLNKYLALDTILLGCVETMV